MEEKKPYTQSKNKSNKKHYSDKKGNGDFRRKRRKERELALWGIFKQDFDGEEPIKEIMQNFSDEDYANQLTEVSGDYAQEVVEAFNENQEAIDDLISKYIKEGWRLDKLPNTEKAILRLGVAEMLYTPRRLPKEIAINEAVELAKRYGEDNSEKYINGILNHIAQENLGPKKE